MDDDLEAIISIPEETEGECSPSVVDEEWELAEGQETDEHTVPFNFDVALFVVEESQDTMEQEIDDAISEISGEKAFPCASCEKICKSKGGLTRHINSKHKNKTAHENKNADASVAKLTKEELSSIVEKIKAKITKDGFWDDEMTAKMASVKSNDSLYNHIQPIYERFCYKRNQDRFLMEFYELIPKSCGILKCQNQQLCSLIMISIPDYLVSLFKGCVTEQEHASTSSAIDTGVSLELSEYERGPLSYIAGYVLSKLSKESAKKKNDELQTIVQSMICPDTENTYIEARSRGGLVTPSKDLVQLLEVVENIFREFVQKQTGVVKSIPCEKLCNNALDLPLLKSLWENIMQDCSKETSKQTKKLCLENIVKLYLRVRSFSYAKDYISNFKIQKKAVRSKSLRKELKRKNEK